MAVCPPGFICLTNGVIFFITVFVLLTFYVLVKLVNKEKKQVVNTIIKEQQAVSPPPLHEPPEREYRSRMPINIQTRPQRDYQQIGALYKTGAVNTSSSINTPGNNTNTSVLPLFGRRTYASSSLWNYFTSTSDHSIVKLPIYIDGNNCTKDKGCKELFDGDTIEISALNGTYKVELYEVEAPRYIPYV